jgi:hypothetical protein
LAATTVVELRLESVCDRRVMIVRGALAGAKGSRFRPMACRWAGFYGGTPGSGVFSTLAVLSWVASDGACYSNL